MVNTTRTVNDTLPQFSVQSLAACEVANGCQLRGSAVNADTMYLVIAGTMHMQMSGRCVKAPAGSLLLAPAGLQPTMAPRPGPAVEIVATRNTLIRHGGLLVFDATRGKRAALRVLVGRVSGGLSTLLGATEPTQALLPDTPLSRHAIAALNEEFAKPGPGAADLVAALMKLGLMLFVREMDVGHREMSKSDSTAGNSIARAIAAIVSHPAADHSIASLSAVAGMSRASFLRHFSRHAGTSPRDFVERTRLLEASSLLTSTEMPVKDIAAASGFNSRSHFTRVFQAAYGTSPADFRLGHPENRDTILVEPGEC